MIRIATIDDLESLARLYKEHMIFHNGLDCEKFEIPSDEECLAKMKDRLADFLYRTIVYEDNGAIYGYADYMMLKPGTLKGCIIVGDIFVAQQYRRQGIGTSLVNEIFNDAKNNSCKTVGIDVHINNPIAKKFYEKMGLIPIAIQMEKRL